MLEKLGIGLNIPPFMEGQQQLPSEEIEEDERLPRSEYTSKGILAGSKLNQILTSTRLKKTFLP